MAKQSSPMPAGCVARPRRPLTPQMETHRLVVSSKLPPRPAHSPAYTLSYSYTASVSAGRSLLRQHSGTTRLPIGELFDAVKSPQGTLAKRTLETALERLLSDATGVAAR